MAIERSRFAVLPVLTACLTLAVLLAIVSPLYGYHRDELYFRMLPLEWGYVDQPPLMPLLTQGAIAAFGDSVVALRIVSLVIAVGSLPLLALVAREAGGSRLAQGFAAWGLAGATATLTFGHILITASLDLVVWPAALLFAMRAVLRADGRWWLAAGAVVGASAQNKLLGAVLLVGVVAGLGAFGPWRWLRSGWLWAGAGAAALLAVPAIVYQATNGVPQLAMGAALNAHNAGEVRVLMWPFLALLVGPVLAVFWVIAVVELFRRPTWRPIRLLAGVLVVTVGFVFAAGSQFYYTAGILAVLAALGAVPVADWCRTRPRRIWIPVLLALNALGCAICSLPVLPVTLFGSVGLAAVNTATADQVGWETYVAQITDAAESSGAEAIIASNYGEAGAVDRFGSDLPPVVSGHNALWDLGGPPTEATTVLVVGGQATRVGDLFASCDTIAELDDGVGVDNEEQGEPIAVCRGPVEPWSDLWVRFRHLD
ncbi:MAG: glycosyltransferase family 39 protein [Microbacterium sp.]|uniref:ArnT family glycosyltransferase n=1 Tax=Microbacterium sp. TaxID=51671 RepID=UPI0039E6AA7E